MMIKSVRLIAVMIGCDNNPCVGLGLNSFSNIYLRPIYNLRFILQHIKHESVITQNSYNNNIYTLPKSQNKTLTQYVKHKSQLHFSIRHFVHGYLDWP